jgi:hypothetical protein
VKRLTRTLVVAAGVIACLAAPAVIAQSEKVSVRMTPRPDQSTRMTMTQEIVFDMSFDMPAGAAPAALPGMNMIATIKVTITSD